MVIKYDIDKVEYYSAFKKEGKMHYEAIQMNHEEIVLNETCQLQKNKYCMIPLNIRF
jgi:hypothetical protein